MPRRTQLAGVGHRVVHGGAQLRRRRCAIDAASSTQLETLVPLAPLHQPHNLAPIRALGGARPTLPQVACFDTAFHRTAAAAGAGVRAAARADRRRHSRATASTGCPTNTSPARLPEIDRAAAAGAPGRASWQRRQHVRAGDGKSVATTMGFTALDGLPMGTRCGAIDPGVLLYLHATSAAWTPTRSRICSTTSPACSASRASASDMRELLAATDPRGAKRVDLFVYRDCRASSARWRRRWAAWTRLCSPPASASTRAAVRAKIVSPLGWLGFALDANDNAGSAPRSAPRRQAGVRDPHQRRADDCAAYAFASRKLSASPGRLQQWPLMPAS